MSKDPANIVEGLASVQLYICTVAKNCNLGLVSEDQLVKIRQGPFQVQFLGMNLETSSSSSKVHESTVEDSRSTQDRSFTNEHQWPILEHHYRPNGTSFCAAQPWRRNQPASLGPASDGTPVDTLILYAFSQSEGWREDNLFFWLAKGLVLRSRYHFVVVVSGEIDDSWARLLDRLAAAAPAFEWHRRPDRGRDACAWHAVLRGWIRLRRALAGFARYVILNASCRGPFLPAYYPHPWPEAFLSLLKGGVVLAGPSVFCACARPEPRPGHPCIATPQLHVQSYLLAFARAALPEVLTLLRAICAPTGGPAGEGGLHAWSFEMELTRRVAAAGGGVAALQYVWAGVDLRDAAEAAQVCADSVRPGDTGDPLHPAAYGGGDAHPLELVFFKTNRGVAEAALRRLTRDALATHPWAVPRHVLCGPE